MALLLQAQDLRVEFGPLVAVDDVSFELSGGELLGLVGPNGAGKTTLMRAVAGLHAPTRGAALVLGKPVLGEHDVVRRHVAFAPDTPPAYEELTIDQFLRFVAGAYELSPAETNERIDFWLEHLWLTEKRHALIKTLSRGMRQRVTLARTFIPQPHVILLDEPLSGLDPAGRIQLRTVLGMLRDQGCALIVSSHILADLEAVSTHIAIIERGRILSWNKAEALHHEREERRTYRLTLLDGRSDEAAARLRATAGVTDVRCENRRITFDYHAEEALAVDLLKQLVSADLPIVSFSVIKASLEEAYLRAGVKQVD
jgi:ABC-2 type transport system ATP-binding protein